MMVKLLPTNKMINEHQTNCANKAFTGVLKDSCQVLNLSEYTGKKSDRAAVTITLDPLRFLPEEKKKMTILMNIDVQVFFFHLEIYLPPYC